MASILLIKQLVRLDGLKNEALNGSIGIVTRNQELHSTGRYSIELRSPPSAIVLHPSLVKIQAKNLVAINGCARHGCDEIGKYKCVACDTELYCSRQCQLDDWKIHKIMGACMKEGGRQILFAEVENKLDKLTKEADLKEGKDDKLRILKYRLSFAESQYGNRISGSKESYRERGDVRIEIWEIEITILY
jgi:hypothetical protein